MALTALGVTGFSQIGPPQWEQDSWDLDQVIIPYDGYITGLEAFLTSKPQWSVCPIDPNMFLSGYRSNGDKRYPKINLVYIGKRAGRLPQIKHSSGTSIQSTSASKDFSIGTDIVTFTADISYFAPSASAKWVSREMLAGGGAGAASGSLQLISLRINGAKVTNSAAISRVLSSYFTTQVIVTPSSEELVPGQYFANSATNTLQYVSIN